MTDTTRREAAIRAGVRAEAITIVWMIIEAALAVIAGVKARSVLVTAFGIDSVIELLSAVVVLWRIKNDSSRVETVERRAATMSGVLLVLLCLYIVASSAFGLVRHIDPEQTTLGLVIAALAVVLMPLLAAWKRRINRAAERRAPRRPRGNDRLRLHGGSCRRRHSPQSLSEHLVDRLRGKPRPAALDWTLGTCTGHRARGVGSNPGRRGWRVNR